MNAIGIESNVAVDHSAIHDAGILESNLPIFNQDWWIKIARGHSDYRELTVMRQNKIVGRLTFVLRRTRLGIVRGYDPPWSHLGGPIVDERLSRSEQAEVIESLIQQLPGWISFSFVCTPNLTYADLVRNEFRKAGFEHSTQLTYIRSPEEGNVLKARTAKHRGHFKRAAKSLECVDVSAKEFVRFFQRNLTARRLRSYAPVETLTPLIEEAVARRCARAIAARPRSLNGLVNVEVCSHYDAAIVYVWDKTRCYYWLATHRIPGNGEPTERAHPDATKLLAANAIEHAHAMRLTFDADGVVTPGAENMYRNMLGLRHSQHRDVFHRVNTLDRLYRKFRQGFEL